MKNFFLVFALSLSPVLAQFAWDDEPANSSVDSVLDQFNAALRTPVIEPIRTIERVVSVIQPFVSPVVDVDPLVEQCGLEPQVARAAQTGEIVDDGECPQFLGRLSANPCAADSTANPYSTAGKSVFVQERQQPLRHAGTMAVRGLN